MTVEIALNENERKLLAYTLPHLAQLWEAQRAAKGWKAMNEAEERFMSEVASEWEDGIYPLLEKLRQARGTFSGEGKL